MQQVYLGDTLINDSFLGSIRVEDFIAFKQPLFVEYLIVGGGGAGGVWNGGGGGGGGLISGSTYLPRGTFQLTIGRGAASIVDNTSQALNGGNSTFLSFTALGGGGGGNGNTGSKAGKDGGSGGGAAGPQNTNDIAGGTGSLGQGFNGGGVKFSVAQAEQAGAGGGGARSAAPKATVYNSAYPGGSGSQWVDGIYYAGGGGGATPNSSAGGAGGIGGGGTGGGASTFYATSGSNDLGGGGGGALRAGLDNTSGGSGIVKIRYAGTGSQAEGGIITYSNGYTYHTFTSSSLAVSNGTGSFIY